MSTPNSINGKLRLKLIMKNLNIQEIINFLDNFFRKGVGNIIFKYYIPDIFILFKELCYCSTGISGCTRTGWFIKSFEISYRSNSPDYIIYTCLKCVDDHLNERLSNSRMPDYSRLIKDNQI